MAARPAPIRVSRARLSPGRSAGERHRADPPAAGDSIAGYLAAMAIFICLIGLAWHPLRLILPGS